MGRDDDLVLHDLGVAPRLIHSDHFHLVLIDLEEMPPQAQVHGSRLNLVWLDGLDDPLSGFQQAYQGRSGNDRLPCGGSRAGMVESGIFAEVRSGSRRRKWGYAHARHARRSCGPSEFNHTPTWLRLLPRFPCNRCRAWSQAEPPGGDRLSAPRTPRSSRRCRPQCGRGHPQFCCAVCVRDP